MTIRARLTFWYAGIMFVSLLAMGALLYFKFVVEPRRPGSNDTPQEIAEDQGDFAEVFRIVLWCGVPAAGLALVGGWWLMRRSLGPVGDLTRAAEKITEQNLQERLPSTGNGDELDRLTEVLNAMTARLDGSFQRIREFTLHASHELKTPLTVMHGELETALREENLSAVPRERLLSQLDEVQRLSKIVDGLTLLTKADAGQIQLAHEPVRLDEVVREAFADAQILAEPRGVKVKLAACDELTVKGDRHRLRQLLLNLADNAIKYNEPGGWVTMSLGRVEDTAELTIDNTGPGIPPKVLPRVFDRFFRGDPAHGDGVDGCGLGLSIAQWIVSAHGGSIGIASEPAKSTVVTIRLPLPATIQGA
jgi:signal transduction histidine kinase